MTAFARMLMPALWIALGLILPWPTLADGRAGDAALVAGAENFPHLEWRTPDGRPPRLPADAEYMRTPPRLSQGGAAAGISDPPFELGGGAWVREKVGDTIIYEADVMCGEKKIGQLHLEYYLWKGNSTADADPNDIGGAAMIGGFQLDPTVKCQLEKDWIWGFVQTVSATPPGANIWGAANNEWFVDSTDRDDPDYPFAWAGFTKGFQDFPWRFLAAPADTWNGELALVCKNLTTQEMKVMGSVLWGFRITAAGAVEQDGNYGSPNFWGPASPVFFQTVLKDWPDQNDYSDWTAEAGCCCATLCGNGVVDPGEECDDGNTDECDLIHPQKPLDACNNECMGLICKDPSRIKFTNGLDAFKSHGAMVPMEGRTIDFASGVTISLTAGQGLVFETSVPAGAIEALTNGAFKYRNAAARHDGGIYRLKATPTRDGTYKVTVHVYDELGQAATDMVTHIIVGGREWTVHALWRQTRSGWVFVGPINRIP